MQAPSLATRAAGVLLHPTSLPGPHGSGDLGPAAHRFARFLEVAGARVWQMLPVGPAGPGGSPYDSPSAFALGPMLTGLEPLAAAGWLEPRDLGPRTDTLAGRVDHARTAAWRRARLQRAFERFRGKASRRQRHELEAFRERARGWLDDWTLFVALKEAHRGAWWLEWEPELRERRPAALARARRRLRAEISFHELVQLALDQQWAALRATTQGLGISLLGDVPMFVAHDSADVWAHRELFQLGSTGRPTAVAGVPPDYFSEDGQRWGNPLYRWSALKQTGYAWWLDRLEATLQRFDAVRIDHFIGLHRAWRIPARAKTARDGRFVRVPGAELLLRLRSRLGRLPLVAEDLGLVTPEVKALRDRFGLPGMRVLQFAFGDDEGCREYLPHRFSRETVVYTGTHDNDTTLGWFRSLTPPMRARVMRYLGTDAREVHWDLVRVALSSVANLAVFPLQDLLGLGSEARMNTPGTSVGNWAWRVRGTELSNRVADRLRGMCEAHERVP